MPSSARRFGAFAEEGLVKPDADMLEHADRHDAIEVAVDVAIIHQPERRILRAAALERPVLRALELLLRQRDAGDPRAGNFGEIERKAAPAAADIEHRGAGFDAQFGREMPLLGELRIVERQIRRFEIGAAILLVAVEKQRIEPAVEIVVVRHVVAGAGPQIQLLQAAEQIAHEPRQRPIRRGDGLLTQQDRKHVRNRALLDDKGAVHIGFAELQLGVDQHRALRPCRGEAHRDGRSAAIAEGVCGPRRRRDRKRPAADIPT